jgi:small subunit ribosomal protein S15e
MADDAAAAEMKKKRTFRKFTYRGVDLDQLLDMNHEQLMELFPCRIRRKFSRGLKVRKDVCLFIPISVRNAIPVQVTRAEHCF